MMDLSVADLQFLSKLRSSETNRLPVAELVSLHGYDIVPEHTGGGMIGRSVFLLHKFQMITLEDNDGGLLEPPPLRRYHGDEAKSEHDYLDTNYDTARFLRGRENKIFVALTPLFGAFQHAFGLSLSNSIKRQQSGGTVECFPTFGIPSRWGDSSDVFTMMPFAPAFDGVYQDHIKEVCMSADLSCARADEMFGSNNIVQDIWNATFNAKIVIADCTGRNPNVFYELGVAHTLGKPTIIITQNADDVPFDISHLRYIRYEYTPRGMSKFENDLSNFIGEVMPLNKSAD